MVIQLFFFFKFLAVIICTAARGLSLVVENSGYSLVVVCRLLTAAASLVFRFHLVL